MLKCLKLLLPVENIATLGNHQTFACLLREKLGIVHDGLKVWHFYLHLLLDHIYPLLVL